jgi:hypothetical protein
VTRRHKRIGVIVMLVALASFSAWPIWKMMSAKAVSATLYEKTKVLVEKNPRLQPEWDAAMQDGVLTWPEAQDIWNKAGDKIEPDQ